ncbi:MAG: PhnD/SsuA/transferrin family substrate-binding protein [Rhodoblastus sp.]|nr:PhnD/SsuA/transferrin family substrate-binding protein [Rhodoblastus sp.]
MRALTRVAALFLALAAFCDASADAPAPLRIGVLAYRGTEEAERTWQSTFDHLARALPGRRVEVLGGTAAFLTAAVAANRLDFLITNPGHYLELKVNYSAVALATEQDLDGPTPAQAVGAAIFVPNGHPEIQTLADLRNLRIAAVASDAFGYRAATRELLERGVDPARDITPVFVGFPVDEVARAVQAGRADGGVIRSCALEKMIAEGAIDKDAFRVVGRRSSGALNCQVSTRLYPGWPFVKVAQTPAPLAREVAQALFAMQPGTDDKAWAQPDDYATVQDLYRTLKVGPYAPFTRLGLADFIFENRYWAVLIAMAAAWWLTHVARVSYLVRKRTRELQLAHEAARLKGEQMEHTVRLSLMGEMASSLAHEINQPLAAILTYARGCERRIEGGADPGSLRDAVQRIAVQAERAGDIVRRMKDFVRKNPAPQVPIDPAVALHDARALFEPTATAAGVIVESDIPDTLPAVRADRLQLEEVIINLLQNALDAVAMQEEKQIVLRVRLDHDRLDICVADNGPGLAPEARERLFDPFFTTKKNGLGLGLSLSRTIAEAHGGSLLAEMDATGMTTFRFYLPLIEEAARA